MLHDERELLFLILVGETCSYARLVTRCRLLPCCAHFFFFFYLMLDDLIDARLDFMRGMEKKKDGKRFVRGVKTKRKFFEGNHWVDL